MCLNMAISFMEKRHVLVHISCDGKISGTNHPFVEHFKFTQAHTSQGIEVKQTIPAPAQILVELLRPDILPHVRKVYEDNQTLIKDIIAAYRQVIDDLYEAGARTIQLDDCTWGVLVAPLPKGFAMDEGKDEKEVRRELANLYLTINNAVLADQPDDLTLSHTCLSCGIIILLGQHQGAMTT